MKKWIAALLAVGMLLALAVCGERGTAPAQGETASALSGQASTKLQIAWWGNMTRNERTQAALKLYGTEHPEVSVESRFIGWDNYWDLLASQAAGHVLPDIIQMDYKYLAQYVEHGLLMDLTPYIESGLLDVSKMDKSILDTGRIGDGIYAICNGINAPALLYNEKVLRETGIVVHDFMTMEEFLNICRAVYQKTGYKTNIAYGQYGYLDYFCQGYGEQLFGEGRMGASREVLAEYYTLYLEGAREGWLLDMDVFSLLTPNSVEQDPMIYGTGPENMSWCCFAHSNRMSATAEVAGPDMEIGVTTWPSRNPVRSNHLMPSMFLSVSTDSREPEAAVELLDYFTNSVECNEILLVERGIPVSSEVAQAINDRLSSPDQVIVGFIRDVVAPHGSAPNLYTPAQAEEIYDLNLQLMESVFYGEMTPEEAADRLITEGNQLLAGG